MGFIDPWTLRGRCTLGMIATYRPSCVHLIRPPENGMVVKRLSVFDLERKYTHTTTVCGQSGLPLIETLFILSPQ